MPARKKKGLRYGQQGRAGQGRALPLVPDGGGQEQQWCVVQLACAGFFRARLPRAMMVIVDHKVPSGARLGQAFV